MKLFPVLALILYSLPLLCLAESNDIPRLIDTDGPSQGIQPLNLHESWRVGGEDEDVIFGRIVDLKKHPDGTFYILDNQLCQVVVVSGDGEHLAELSRQGDGPGELRQPTGLVFLEDDVLGVGMGFPGKVVSMKTDGTPVGTLYPIGEPAEGNIGIMMSLQKVDGILVASGGRMVFADHNNSHTERFLSMAYESGGEFNRILETTTPIDPTGQEYVETDNYYIDSRYALGPEGTIYAPMKRDAYEISVFDKAGKLIRVFGRQTKPRKRTQSDKEEVSPLISMGGSPENQGWVISVVDECVYRIMVNEDDGTIWVLTPQGNNDQPEGILETWDVFSTEGEYLKQVPVPLGNEMNDGTCYLVGGGRLVVVKGTASSFTGGNDSEDDEEETEVEPQEVICYEMR
jgi:hypothetical protein